MPIVIADVGAVNANSYVTVAAADTYFSDSFGRSLWASSSQENREAAVITASRSLDMYMTWEGYQATTSQSMEWPRNGASDKTGRSYANDIIPGPVKFATFELAYYIIENGGLSFAQQSIDRVKVGPVDVEFTPQSVDAGIPSFVENLISHIGRSDLVGPQMAKSVPLVRL